ncbi:DUF4179 domain-containing protein [Paenibacillus sp. JX-17]|uniref:DUF4179 domain-containing protein n=1 Tax=Paenibacillus lacisoli TaxID=3064525 RepID=A0ABT9CBS3_9BACL|nr:DUF4179 domain-containing protein [Paenibacillus sp. JX-17]MDO7906706.1 DUF4179 domain-containing protein [Paenibacillus sp. JX-17]
MNIENKEQSVLMDDARDVMQRAAALPEMKLQAAVSRGAAKGRKQRMRRRYSYSLGAAAAVLAFLFVWTYVQQTENDVTAGVVHTSDPAGWVGFQPFMGAHDPTLALALKNQLVKPVYQSGEKGGVRLDVTGAVTDGRKLYILISLHNNTDQSIYITPRSLTYGGVKVDGFGAELGEGGSTSDADPGKTGYLTFSANLIPGAKYGSEANFAVNVYKEAGGDPSTLDVTFDLDLNMLQDRIQTYKAEQPLTVKGQKIQIEQVTYTPLNSYVDLNYDKHNQEQIFELIYPVLKGADEGRSERLGYVSSDMHYNRLIYSKPLYDMTLVFKPSQLKQRDQAEFAVAGISALDKDQSELVVDLSQEKIMKAPELANAQFSIESESTGNREDAFLFKVHSPLASSYGKGIELSDTYTDAEGSGHKLGGGGSIAGHNSKGDMTYEQTSVFGKDAQKLPQPLTIGIKWLWNPLTEAQSVQLHPEK